MKLISDHKEFKHLNINESGEYVLVPIKIWEELTKDNREHINTNINDIDDWIKDIGDLIREVRLKNGLTKKQFADKTDLKACQISNFENKKKKPRRKTIEKIDKIFEGFSTKAYKLN